MATARRRLNDPFITFPAGAVVGWAFATYGAHQLAATAATIVFLAVGLRILLDVLRKASK